ncbi:hypothetical protein [Nostoc sp. NMS8]|nr:hypothetical protein [Nostoc sp. NMS8]MBN3961760.1 hypothetical protein [Nostoc sp. NMS8]
MTTAKIHACYCHQRCYRNFFYTDTLQRGLKGAISTALTPEQSDRST